MERQRQRTQGEFLLTEVRDRDMVRLPPKIPRLAARNAPLLPAAELASLTNSILPLMIRSTAPSPLVLVDCRPETEEVLKAVFEPRGVIVGRLLHGRRYSDAPWLVIRGKDHRYPAWQGQFCEGPELPVNESRVDAGCHEMRLPPLFHYGDLIRSVERLLDDRQVA